MSDNNNENIELQEVSPSVMGTGTPTGGIYELDTNSTNYEPVTDWNLYFTFFHGAKFPLSIMENVNYKDVNDDIAALLNRIDELRDAEDYLSAATLINTNKDILEPYVIDSNVVNRLFEEQRNTEIWASQEGQNIYFILPFKKNINDVYIKESAFTPTAIPPFNVINYTYSYNGSRITATWSHDGYIEEYGTNKWKKDYVCIGYDRVPINENDTDYGYVITNENNSGRIDLTSLPQATNVFIRVFPVSTNGKVNRNTSNILKITINKKDFSW